jgi:hypothetical protein
LFSGKPESGIDNLRSFRAEMKERLGPSDRADADLEMAAHHFVHQLKEINEIRLPCTVGSDENVEGTEINCGVPY